MRLYAYSEHSSADELAAFIGLVRPIVVIMMIIIMIIIIIIKSLSLFLSMYIYIYIYVHTHVYMYVHSCSVYVYIYIYTYRPVKLVPTVCRDEKESTKIVRQFQHLCDQAGQTYVIVCLFKTQYQHNNTKQTFKTKPYIYIYIYI